jgi:hypothetical protein|tara:strand:- start:652 stop:1320 length:669 start_codon:yes stop_codon:yes gene_type:complete
MPYVRAHTFSPNGNILGSQNNANIVKLKEHINGGIVAGDISDVTRWCEAKHIMKGMYFGTDNTHEMTTGLYAGPALNDLPTFNPGYMGRFMGDITEDREPVPGAGITFYLEHEADILIDMMISPRFAALLAGGTVDGGRIEFRLDGFANNTSSSFFMKEIDIDTNGSSVDIVGFYRRRFYQHKHMFRNVGAGYHLFQLFGNTSGRSVPLKFFTYKLQAFYKV